MSASTTPTENPCCGERDREVGGHARLADAALARGDQQRTGLGAVLGERDLAALGVAVRVAVAGGRAGVAVQRLAQVLALAVGHHGELEVDRVDAVELRGGVGHAPLDLVLQRAAGNGERDEDADDAVAADVDVADHVEVDDRTVEFGILDRSERLDDVGFGDGGGHSSSVATAVRICTTRIGTIRRWRPARRSPQPCRRSPMRSVTRRGARSTCSPAIIRRSRARRRHRGDRIDGRHRGRCPRQRRSPSPRQVGRRRVPRSGVRSSRRCRRRPPLQAVRGGRRRAAR